MTKIIDCLSISSNILEGLYDEIENNNYKPVLAIVFVGDDPASQIYINNKIKTAEKLGVETRLIKLDYDISNVKLAEVIGSLNKDNDVNGIIVQMPLPKHLNQQAMINLIAPEKDVDGFTPHNQGLLIAGKNPIFSACTPLGIIDVLKNEFNKLQGLHAVVIGRSFIVGRPLAALLLNNDMTVTICHSKTKNIEEISKKADIVITATGCSSVFDSKYFSRNATIIDVGLNRLQNGEISGDVNFNDVYGKVKSVTKVPGGIGPMTVAKLMENTVKAYKLQNI